MNRIKLTRPSPAMTVAVAALVVAVVGTAMAAPTAIESVLNKKEKKQTKAIAKNQANNQITQRAPGLSVANANTANSANSAANADKVDGHDASCPAGTSQIAGLCYDTVRRSGKNWVPAARDCADENASLPTVGQLMLATDELGVGSQATGNDEWTDSLHVDDGTLKAIAVDGNRDILDLSAGVFSRTYRCVLPLVR